MKCLCFTFVLLTLILTGCGSGTQTQKHSYTFEITGSPGVQIQVALFTKESVNSNPSIESAIPTSIFYQRVTVPFSKAFEGVACLAQMRVDGTNGKAGDKFNAVLKREGQTVGIFSGKIEPKASQFSSFGDPPGVRLDLVTR